VTAQAPVQALRELMAAEGFAAADVADLELDCAPKVCSHHDIRSPQDVMQAQYSVPFCLALALHRDPSNPRAFDDTALADPAIRATCAAITLRAASDLPTAWSARLSVGLHDGRRFTRDARSFRGTPEDPMPPADERTRFLALCQSLGRSGAEGLHARLAALETEPAFPSVPTPLAG
jgi:2-methylcitrate dehydratase PrpD